MLNPVCVITWPVSVRRQLDIWCVGSTLYYVTYNETLLQKYVYKQIVCSLQRNCSFIWRKITPGRRNHLTRVGITFSKLRHVRSFLYHVEFLIISPVVNFVCHLVCMEWYPCLHITRLPVSISFGSNNLCTFGTMY